MFELKPKFIISSNKELLDFVEVNMLCQFRPYYRATNIPYLLFYNKKIAKKRKMVGFHLSTMV